MEEAQLASRRLFVRLKSIRDAIGQDLVERDLAVRLALLAALAGEHVLLLGPPGTAKSHVARRLRLAFAGATYFERLLTRFTVPEELFGPLSIRGLEQDRYERLTASYLPTASFAFLDEIFKANSAILNSLLTLLNEREFDNGAERQRTPLLAVIGASNELPEGEELDALYDRFLLRLHVDPVSAGGFRALLGLRGDTAPVFNQSLPLNPNELRDFQRAAEHVEVPDEVIELLAELRAWTEQQRMRVSDRRWRKIVKLLQVSALSNGRHVVSLWDCWLLQHCLWSRPEERANVHAWYAARVGATKRMDPARLTRMIARWEGRLKSDRESRSQRRGPQGELLFETMTMDATAVSNGPLQGFRDGKKLYLAPPNASGRYNRVERVRPEGYTADELDELDIGNVGFARWSGRPAYLADPTNWHTKVTNLPALMEATRHKAAYVTRQLEQLDQVRAEITRYQDALRTHVTSLHDEIQAHLWVPAEFTEQAAATLRETQQVVESLSARLAEVRSGFERLPIEPDVELEEMSA